MTNKVLSAVEELYCFVREKGDWKTDLSGCLSKQLELERQLFVVLLEENDPKPLVVAMKWLFQRDPGSVEWLELLVKRLIDLMDPTPHPYIILSESLLLTGYDDEAMRHLKAAEQMTDDLTVTKMMIQASRDPGVQLKYAKKWDREEPEGIASEIIQFISQTGERIPPHIHNMISRRIDMYMYKSFEELEMLVGREE